MSELVSNCPLCEEHGLHVMGENETQMMQCLNCGYVTTSKFIGNKETNEEYLKLTDDMKNWSKNTNDRIWIPTIMTLPVGILYPESDKDGNMKWSFAEMKDIPKEKQKDYPDGNGGFYERMYDTDNTTTYNEFFEGMLVLTEKMKDENKTPNGIKLPKLKKMVNKTD